MKSNSLKSSLLISLIKSILFSLALTLLQYQFRQSSEFAGQKVSSIEHGLIDTYFSVIAVEVCKIILFISMILWPVFLLHQFKKQSQFKKISLNKYSIFIWAICSYSLFFIGSVIQYPALYEPFLAASLKKFIFQSSFYLSPNSFFICSVLILLTSLGFVIKLNISIARIMQTFKRRTTAIGSMASFAIACTVVVIIVSINRHTPSLAESLLKQPNILLIGIDSLRFDKSRNQSITPNITKLIQSPNTIYFKDHHVGVPRTFPSWVEIFQGNYAAKTGIRHMFPSLSQARKKNANLVTYLNQAGYKTGVCSDFAGDIFPRFNSGLQEIHAPAMSLDSLIRQNLEFSFPVFMPFILSKIGRRFFPDLKGNPAYANPNHLTESSIDFINTTKNQAPFFLTLFYSTAHFPYAAPWPHYSKFANSSYPGPYFFQKNPDLESNADSTSQADIAQVKSLYDGALSSIDQSLSELFSFLKQESLWDNTIIIVTADHGEDLFENHNGQGHGEHLLGDKVLKVPLILKLPKNLKPSVTTISDLSRSIDIAPTILDIAKIKQNSMSGVSFLPAFFEKLDPTSSPSHLSSKPYENLISYSETGIWFSNKGNTHFQKNRLFYPGITGLLNFDPGGTRQIVLNNKFEKVIQIAKHRSITAGKYKLIYMPKGDKVVYQLFDRKNDSENLHDLAQSNPDILQEMISMFQNEVEKIEPFTNIVDQYVVPQ
ncbi:MAG: sulfatase-like hydrolase/transferase [Bdellovibrionota bacterium]